MVKRGKVDEFEQWVKDVGNEVIRFEGHLGTNILRPSSSERPEYIIIFRFDTYENLMRWEDSDVRRYWIEKVQPLITRETRAHHLTGLEYWFTLPEQPGKKAPARHKMAIVTWLALFPLVIVVPPLLLLLIGPWPSVVQIMIIAAVMVLLMTYIVMPVMTRLFARWLY